MLEPFSAPASLPPRFRAQPGYSSLSVRDLLDAREAYHVHLRNLAHVVATAIGRYRIRKGDWYETHAPGTQRPKGCKVLTDARDLFNSVTADWSWPCVLVFVDEWIKRADWRRGKAGRDLEPDQFIPRCLYLPDGRVVPTCVVLLRKAEARPEPPPPLRFPEPLVGGGYPLLTRVQGTSRVGSLGCLVTDGHQTFALTNRHVTGDEGIAVHSLLGGREVRIGTSSPHVLGKKRFDQVYEPWPGQKVFVNLDVGLVRVDDVSMLTTQVLGLGPLGSPVDLNPDTVSLDLIEKPVRAFGAASGLLSGRICALFFRYHAIGGFEYVSDVLIAPDAGRETHPGDSGTLWCLDTRGGGAPGGLYPIALQWGGQVIEESGPGGRPHGFTLATFLSTALRELQLDLVRDWNIGLPEYWGAMGHYSIATFACGFVSGNLKSLMRKNVDRISYPPSRLKASTFAGLSKKPFVPLADVPDYVWKIPGGPARRAADGPSHFADMDLPLPDGPNAGKTLLDLCIEDSANVDPGVWSDYYTRVKDRSKGILPFRIGLIYEEMAAAVAAKDLDRFVAAAGILSHYVGDACQPLHVSHLFDGEPLPAGGKRGAGVHSAYEARMLNANAAALVAGIVAGLEASDPLPNVADAREATLAAVDLMRKTLLHVPPAEIVDAFVAGEDLWERFGDGTIATCVEGARTLAMLWQSAWEAGNGDGIAASKLTARGRDELVDLYSDEGFIPSRTLKQLIEGE